jgi:hypothetical protein
MLLTWLTILVMGGVIVGAIVYYWAVIGGLYKDTMMSHFRHYGEEHRAYPLVRFLVSLSALCLFLAIWIPGLLITSVLTALSIALIGATYVISRVDWLRGSLPRWYFSLLQETTREERRAIAYAWLRLPFRTRLRLNGDSYAFRVFIDEVRMTVIYGARDPDDPWVAWQ